MGDPRDDAAGERVTLTAEDGHALSAHLHSPRGPAAGAVLIAGAMGITQRFYAPLAAWLAERGYLVLTFDYRGMGESRRGSLRGFPADVLTWARLDCGAALRALAERAPGLPLYWLGHSLGGHVIPFVPGRERIERIVTVAAGSGYWRENVPQLRRRVWLLWYGIAPLLVRALGWFPGRRLGMVGDLPGGVMAQWRRWCLDPEYAAGAEPGAREAYAAVTTPIVSLSFTDDAMMSERNIASLHSFYARAPRTMRRLSPADAGVREIGHFGFFRPAPALWERYLLPELRPAG